MNVDDLGDPCPDVHELFMLYDNVYFSGLLCRSAVTVDWSSRMTLCAGVCDYMWKNGHPRIRLSQNLLQFRPTVDTKNTLLHEMIHAWLFITCGHRDHGDHGPKFQAKMVEINRSNKSLDLYRPSRGYSITIYHNFHDEVNHLRSMGHCWQCPRCGNEVKRVMNRAPSENDCLSLRFVKKAQRKLVQRCTDQRCLWHQHVRFCGGQYVKVREPPGAKSEPKMKKQKGTGASALSVKQTSTAGSSAKQKTLDNVFTRVSGPSHADANVDSKSKMSESGVPCPVCGTKVETSTINEHLDACLREPNLANAGVVGQPQPSNVHTTELTCSGSSSGSSSAKGTAGSSSNGAGTKSGALAALLQRASSANSSFRIPAREPAAHEGRASGSSSTRSCAIVGDTSTSSIPTENAMSRKSKGHREMYIDLTEE